jgi:hypothetical protein
MRILRASTVSLLLLCFLTGVVNAQACTSTLVVTTLQDTTCLYGNVQAAVTNPSLFTNITWSAVGGSIYPNGASSSTEADNSFASDVSITASATEVATGCAVSNTVVIPIVPLDPPPMTVSSDGPICYGSSVTISIPQQPAGSEIIWDYTGVKLGGGNGQNFITLSAPPGPSFSLRVRLTDPRSCATQNTITVPVHIPVVPVLQADDFYGCAYAVKTVTVTNPSAYTSYTWSVTNGTIIGPNDQPTVHIGLLAAGTNTDVTFTASDGTCPITGSAGFYSTQPTAAISVSGAPYCAGRNATLYVTTDGFFHPTYLWSNGATTNSITVAADAPGPYTVTVTNEYGCSTTSAPVTVPFEPTDTRITATGPTTFCAGGHVFLAPVMPGQSYLWSNGATTQTIDVTQSGDYSVTVNTGQCSYVAPAVHVTVNPLPPATITASGPTTLCPGGSVTLTASVASSYAWSNGATTQAITVNAAGSYSVTETNVDGCTAISAATVVIVSSNPVATITAAGPTTFCTGGSVTLTASADASYLWSTGATTQSIAASATGNYTVTVTNANGCSATSAATAVTVNALPVPHITPVQQYTSLAPENFILAQVSGNTYTYCGAATVGLFARGGGAGSQYHWSTGEQFATIYVTQSGIYTVTITDAQGCSADDTVTIQINPIPIATISASGPLAICPNGGSVVLTATAADSYLWSTGETTRSIAVTQPGAYHVVITTGSCSASSSDVNVTLRTIGNVAGGRTFCPGGSVTLTAPDGTSYAWNTGAATQSITVSTAGDYSVTVTDAAGCPMMPAPASVTSSTVAVSVNASATTICSGQTATLTATATGGTGNYSYQWFTLAGPIAGATSLSYNATAFDAYYVVATDAGGCSVSSISNPIILHVNPTPAGGFYFPPTSFCSGGTNTVSAFPLSGDTYAWTVTNGTVQSLSNYSAIITAGTSGNVVIGLTITKNSGCSWTGTTSIPIVPSPPVPAMTPSGPTTFCQGDHVTLTAPAGYSYVWRLGSTVVGDNQQSFFTGVPGSYTVTVTNANGCSATSAPITVTVNANPTASITPSGPTTFCAGGSVTLTASSGTSYLWSTGATTQSIVASTSANYTVTVRNTNGCNATSAPTLVTVNANPVSSITVFGPTTFCAGGNVTLAAPSPASSYLWSTGETTQAILATSSGNYTVTVTNASGCTAMSAPVAVTVRPSPVATITASGPTTFCAGGNVTLTASSGASYSWSNGATTQSIVASTTRSHNVTVTDAAGCSATSATANVSVIANPPPTISVSGPTTFCAGGGVALTASGGSGYSYLWSTGATTQAIIVTSGGSYSVAATANGCTSTSAPVVVTVNANPPAPVISADGPTTFCAGGSVTLTAPAGFTYSWSNGSTTQSIVASTSGNYTVTDTNGCSATSAATAVTVNALPAPSIVVEGPLTYCDLASSTILNGSPLTGTWFRNGVAVSTTARIFVRDFGTGTGSFVWRATNAAGCSKDSDPVVVTVKPTPNTAANFGFLCWNGTSDAQSLETSPGTTYQWSVTNGTILSGNGTSRIVYAAAAGATTVGVDWTVTTASGCAGTNHFDVAVDVMQTTASAAGPTTFCAGGSVVLTAATVPGAGYYQWSNGAQGQSITVAAGGTYSVHAIRATNGCAGKESNPVSVTVQTPSTPTITAGGPTTFCAGGSVTLTASAGSSYLWSNGATTAAITVSASGNYSVTVTNAAGCSTLSAPTAVTVRPRPTSTVSGGGAICLGSSTTITATLTGTAPWSVTWSDNVTESINSGTTASRTVSPAATTTYTVTWVSDANCSGTTSGSAIVTVKAVPTASVSGGGAICPTASATVTATLTGTAPFTVIWSDNVTQTINSGTTASRTVSPAVTTTYTVTSVTDATSCPRPGTGSANVTRNVAASIATQPSNVTTTRNTNVTLSVVAAGTSPISYQWFNGNGTAVSGATATSYTTSFTKKGTNTFYVEVWNACNTTHAKSTTVTVTVN